MSDFSNLDLREYQEKRIKLLTAENENLREQVVYYIRKAMDIARQRDELRKTITEAVEKMSRLLNMPLSDTMRSVLTAITDTLAKHVDPQSRG